MVTGAGDAEDRRFATVLQLKGAKDYSSVFSASRQESGGLPLFWGISPSPIVRMRLYKHGLMLKSGVFSDLHGWELLQIPLQRQGGLHAAGLFILSRHD